MLLRCHYIRLLPLKSNLKIVPWGDDVNTPSLSKFYKFEKLIMKDLQSETQFSVSDSEIGEIDDTDAINLGQKVYTTDDYHQ